MRTLYLGLRPKAGTFHYPVIKTVFCGDVEGALSEWDRFTHIIFTSQTAVEYWPGPWDKQYIAIGHATGRLLQDPLIAEEATQEGIMDLVAKTPGYFFYPHARKARPDLVNFMQKHKIGFFDFVLYDTVFQQLEPVPNLDEFDEIVFTSPSTVEGFMRIFGKMPEGKKISCIGPVTQRALAKV